MGWRAVNRMHRPRYCHSRRWIRVQRVMRPRRGRRFERRVNRPAQVQPAPGKGAPLHPEPQARMRLVFEPEQQGMLEITQHRQLVFGDTRLITRAFPAPDLAVPCQPPCRRVSPADVRRGTRSRDKSQSQCHAPIRRTAALNKPEQAQQQTAKPQAQKKRAQKTRTPQRINNRRGVVRGQGVGWLAKRAGKNQTRLKTSVPFVPPNPKLFLTATSILASRAVLAQ